jgi:hypothetical protein
VYLKRWSRFNVCRWVLYMCLYWYCNIMSFRLVRNHIKCYGSHDGEDLRKAITPHPENMMTFLFSNSK